MSKYIMAFDQGTTSSRCVIFDKELEIVSSAQKEITQYFPKPGYVEHDPMEIWSSQLSVATESMAKIGISAADIAALGITNQRETTIIWERATGKPIHNAIVWQCRRTADYCDILKQKGLDTVIAEKTGLVADAYFSGTKIKWLLDNVPGAREKAVKGELLFGTVDTWLLWNLTKGRVFATDYSNASRTMLYNIHELKWDEELLAALEIPYIMLPEVMPSCHAFGKTDASLLGGEIEIAGVAGDQQAALFGQCCYEPGAVKNTYGTGCFILMNTGKIPAKSKNGLLTTIAWGFGGEVIYALEGSVFVAGAAIQWLRDGLKMIDGASFTEEYAKKAQDTQGVYFVPAFAGLGAPYWDQHARGVITGLTRSVKKEHLIRAALESIAYQSRDVINAMLADSGVDLKLLRVDGGASANNFLMQFQSDILGVDVRRPEITESTALGAACLAGLSKGYYRDTDEIIEKSVISRVFESRMDAERRKALLDGWDSAVGRTRS